MAPIQGVHLLSPLEQFVVVLESRCEGPLQLELILRHRDPQPLLYFHNGIGQRIGLPLVLYFYLRCF